MGIYCSRRYRCMPDWQLSPRHCCLVYELSALMVREVDYEKIKIIGMIAYKDQFQSAGRP